jgi:CBS domain-containing protein
MSGVLGPGEGSGALALDAPRSDEDAVTNELHDLCVIGPSGEVHRGTTVYCRTHGTSVAAERCGGCARLVRVGPGGSTLECLPPPVGRDRHPCGRADAVPVARVMSQRGLCVTRDLGIDEIAALLDHRRLPAVTVVDEELLPVGVVTRVDVARGRERGPGVSAKMIMTPLAFTLSENSSVARGAALMAIEGVSEVPVVDGRGRVVGVLSSIDVMRWLARGEGYLVT